MFTDKEFIDQLNAVLKHKLTGINQYFLHARMLKHRGNVALADYEYKASLEAMKHADMLVEHILCLGGSPNLQELGALSIGETEHAMLAGDLAHAEKALADIAAASVHAGAKEDVAGIGLLNRILESQQEHIGFVRSRLAQLMEKCA